MNSLSTISEAVRHDLGALWGLALLATLVGDYVLQSDWMAQAKTSRTWPAFVHVLVYTACFLIVTRNPVALVAIGSCHFVIDRFRLARHVCWAKNFLAPRVTENTLWWHPWSECQGTGYHKERPPWMAVWLMIIADNVMHMAWNMAVVVLLVWEP